MTSKSNPSDSSKVGHQFDIYRRSEPFRLRDPKGKEGCTATIVDTDIQLEQFAPSKGGMSIEIIYSIKPEQIDTVAEYFGYIKGLSKEQLLVQIDKDGKGLELWVACRDNEIPDIERFTWIS